MRPALWSPFFLVIALVSAATGENIEGSWTLTYASGVQWKTIDFAAFTFHVDGDKLTGMASVGYGWPGVAPISEGKVEGNRIDFMVNSELESSSGLPRMHFIGTVSGDKIELSMVRLFDTEPDGRNVTVFEGRRALPGEVTIPTEIGAFTNGRYHHSLTGTEFTLPSEWRFLTQGPSSGGGEQVYFGSLQPGGVHAFVWLKPQTAPAARIQARLESAIELKLEQRRDLREYRMLPATIEHKLVNGQPALSVEAEFYDADGALMTEYHTWVMSVKTHVYISARIPANDFPEAKTQVDSFLATFLVP